jgi:1-acyl-sn-glycerol-3-phosphate acyltransferase
MFRAFAMLVFRLLGWRLTDRRPVPMGSAIYLVVPHTSNWDFPLGLLVRSIARIQANYLAKQSLFRPPIGWLFRALGGYPVDRSKSTNLTDQVVHYFRTVPGFSVAITPEGTRKQVAHWKTGFWHIAKQAGVPLVFPPSTMPRRSHPERTVVRRRGQGKGHGCVDGLLQTL